MGISSIKIFLSRLIESPRNDDLVKSQKERISVIPANPGSGPGQAPESNYFKFLKILWTPVSIGATTFYENIKNLYNINPSGKKARKGWGLSF
jgi:hypothetical protein